MTAADEIVAFVLADNAAMDVIVEAARVLNAAMEEARKRGLDVSVATAEQTAFLPIPKGMEKDYFCKPHPTTTTPVVFVKVARPLR